MCNTEKVAGYTYFEIVPSRAFSCESTLYSARIHAAAMATSDRLRNQERVPVVLGQMPVIDEEYFEWISVLKSAARARRHS